MGVAGPRSHYSSLWQDLISDSYPKGLPTDFVLLQGCCFLASVDKRPVSHHSLDISLGNQGVQDPCWKAVNINLISEPRLTGCSNLKPLTQALEVIGRRNVSVESL